MSVTLDIGAIEQATLAVTGWRDCNQAWLDTSEDVDAAVVGHIDEDGNTYPVATIDCGQYYSGDSLPLAKFYAAANPAAVLELIRRLREAEKQRDELLPAISVLQSHCELMAAADWRKWEELASPKEFERWVKSRAAHMAAQAKAAIAKVEGDAA